MLLSKASLKSKYNLLQRRPLLVHGKGAQDIQIQLPVVHSSPVAQRTEAMDDPSPRLVLTRALQLAVGLAHVQ